MLRLLIGPCLRPTFQGRPASLLVGAACSPALHVDTSQCPPAHSGLRGMAHSNGQPRVTAYSLFAKGMYAKMKEEGGKLPPISEASKMVAEKYRQLPEETKMQLKQEAGALSGRSERAPSTKRQTGWILFLKDAKSEAVARLSKNGRPSLPADIMVEASGMWRNLSETEKQAYSDRARAYNTSQRE